MIGILAALVFALSLCADSFAVANCSSVTLKPLSGRTILRVSLVFSLIHASFLLCGWGFGDLFAGAIGKVAPFIGFLLLAYVGGSLVVSGWRNTEEIRDLNGIRNILIGAVATSIDALAVGISLSMDRDSLDDMLMKVAVLFIVTFVTVALGMKGGQLAGRRYGRPARLFGGFILLCIGLHILLKAFFDIP